MALLPPIPLYRRILRTHRKKLGHEERVLGDLYVKAEFRAHREVENPVQIVSNRHEDLTVENLCTCWKYGSYHIYCLQLIRRCGLMMCIRLGS